MLFIEKRLVGQEAGWRWERMSGAQGREPLSQGDGFLDTVQFGGYRDADGLLFADAVLFCQLRDKRRCRGRQAGSRAA